jgi:hypothetical protein
MNIRHKLGALPVTGAAVALVIGLGVMPASAASLTWTVTPGGAYTATLVKDTSDTFGLQVDNHAGFLIECHSVTGHLLFKSGSGLTNPIGHVQKIVTKGCYWNFSTPLPVTLTFSASMALDGGDYQVGTTTGRAFHVHVAVTSPGCSFVGDGKSATADDAFLPFTYYNDGDQFQLGVAGGAGHGSTEAYDVSGCTGDYNISDGNPVSVIFEPTLSGDLTITSP